MQQIEKITEYISFDIYLPDLYSDKDTNKSCYGENSSNLSIITIFKQQRKSTSSSQNNSNDPAVYFREIFTEEERNLWI